jgi:hypothetical protein
MEIPPAASAAFNNHCAWAAECILKGEVTFFLGAGVNLCNRPADLAWTSADKQHLPSGDELARHLSAEFRLAEPSVDLARVAQYGATIRDTRDLYTKLHRLFGASYPPTAAHAFLASTARSLRERRATSHPLIISTNYDDLMEVALESEKVPYDLLVYESDSDNKGKFRHRSSTGTTVIIKRPNAYSYPLLEQAPCVLKIHGSVDRSDPDADSYVITEDHYIEYLANRPLEQIIPASVLDRVRNSRLLFLGYSLRDWNLRVFLRRLTQSQRLATKHWAVMLRADEVEEKFWSNSADVEIWRMSVRDYVAGLQPALAQASR